MSKWTTPPPVATGLPAGKTRTPAPHQPSRGTTPAVDHLGGERAELGLQAGDVALDPRVGGRGVGEVLVGAVAVSEVRVEGAGRA